MYEITYLNKPFPFRKMRVESGYLYDMVMGAWNGIPNWVFVPDPPQQIKKEDEIKNQSPCWIVKFYPFPEEPHVYVITDKDEAERLSKKPLYTVTQTHIELYNKED